jgi:hypothetical protein
VPRSIARSLENSDNIERRLKETPVVISDRWPALGCQR